VPTPLPGPEGTTPGRRSSPAGGASVHGRVAARSGQRRRFAQRFRDEVVVGTYRLVALAEFSTHQHIGIQSYINAQTHKSRAKKFGYLRFFGCRLLPRGDPRKSVDRSLASLYSARSSSTRATRPFRPPSSQTRRSGWSSGASPPPLRSPAVRRPPTFCFQPPPDARLTPDAFARRPSRGGYYAAPRARSAS